MSSWNRYDLHGRASIRSSHGLNGSSILPSPCAVVAARCPFGRGVRAAARPAQPGRRTSPAGARGRVCASFSPCMPVCRGRQPVGSSPRGRGTLLKGGLPLRIEGFIPARAGNTAGPRHRRRAAAVHPRAGGEHTYNTKETNWADGSSPRGRGTRGAVGLEVAEHRFIPARAGNTSRAAAPASEPPVHPRAGGEHRGWGSGGRYVGGSSPRGRGTPDLPHRWRLQLRFIPARAGNTLPPPITIGGPSVHPRAGGEHPLALVRQPLVVRFIPARAGNTSIARKPGDGTAVHPRAGGEHHHVGRATLACDGSSPRGRGTRTRRPGSRPRKRFIPARAGNTHPHRRRRGRGPVHPRAGGEHQRIVPYLHVITGSSPRGRGTLFSQPADSAGEFE